MADVCRDTIDPGQIVDDETDLDQIGDAHAAMNDRRGIESLVRVGSL